MTRSNKTISDVVIREFRIKDYDAVITLWDEAKLPYKPEGRDRRDKIEKEIKQSNAIFLVVELDGKLVGSVFGTHDGRKGWINRLAVSPAWCKQGIAARLVRDVENRLFDLGIEIIACLIEDWNTVSAKVFERLGYTGYSEITYFTKRKTPKT